MNTRALMRHILAVKGLDGGDRVLAKSVAGRFIHALRMQAKRGKDRYSGEGARGDRLGNWSPNGWGLRINLPKIRSFLRLAQALFPRKTIPAKLRMR
jgi:hypothetical protein